MKAPGHPTGNRGCWSHHRTASAARWAPRGVYTLACEPSKGFRPDRAQRHAHFGVRVARFEAQGLRFGGDRALTPLSAVASAAARVVQVPAQRAWYPSPPGNRVRGLQTTRRRGVTAGVRTELRTLVSRPRFGGWWEQGSSGHHQKDLEGERSPWKDRAMVTSETTRPGHGPDDGATP